MGHNNDFGSMWALLLSFSSNVLIDQVTAVIKGTHGPHMSSKEWKAWRDHRGAHLQVRREEVCVFMCGLKWECVCVYKSPCEWFNFNMQVCDASVCVWMCAHKQRREHHQRPVITRNTPTSGSRLQSCSKQMGSLRRQTSSKPAEREIIILDAGLKPPPPDITPISNLADSFTAAPLSSWQLAARLFSKASRFSNGASKKKKSFSSLFCLFNTCITFFIFSSLWSCMRSHCSQLYFELKIAQAFFSFKLEYTLSLCGLFVVAL